MNSGDVGELIKSLRKEAGLTQYELAKRLNVSDKAVSKWERGLGFPDITTVPALAEVLNVNIECLLSGEKIEPAENGGNMKKLAFYVCSSCNNVIMATDDADVSCCGKKLEKLEEQIPNPKHDLKVEVVEDEFYITTIHPMEKEHYISFVALLCHDGFQMVKTYPQWDMQVRIPKHPGKLVWYCTTHGLYSKDV